MMFLYQTYWLFIVISGTNGFRYFQDAIPNGNQVPHPCKPNFIWKGVGHENEAGGGARNLFGLDFFANEKAWTADLCMKDSDGDGMTNGAELGDPDCSWSPGTVPKDNQGLSHPGICEPFDSELCQGKNEWVNCEMKDFECESIKEQGVENITIRLSAHPVPAIETTYICQSFEVPSDKDYHLIATQPYIDNEHIMHHIALYGCPDEAAAVRRLLEKPRGCGMAASSCTSIGIWLLGLPGQCFDPVLGFKFGLTSYKFFFMELHWNNPELRSDYTDSSGLILYYTSNLRPNDAGHLLVGTKNLDIPPAHNSFTITDTCPFVCTTHLNHTIHLSVVNLHMHYLGISASLEHHRHGKKLKDLAVDSSYSYDSPVHHWLNSLEFLPGDELKLTCEYSSMSRTENTYFGADTSAEMCFALITYYPAQAGFVFCGSSESLIPCHVGGDEFIPNACRQEVYTEIWASLYEACPNYECTEACRQKITEAKRHECLGDLKAVQQGFESAGASLDFQYINSCDEDPNACRQEVYTEIWAPLYEACPNYECTEACREKTTEAKKHECLGDLKAVQQGFEMVGASLAFMFINSCDEDFVKPCREEIIAQIWGPLYEACPNYECNEACQEKTKEAKRHECLGDLKAVQQGFEMVGASLAFMYINSCDEDFVKPCGEDIIADIWTPLYEACLNYECTESCREKTTEVKKHECLGDLKAVQQGFEMVGASLAFMYINSCDEDFVKPCGEDIIEEIWAPLYTACPNYECTEPCREKTTEAKMHECLGDLKGVQQGFESAGAGLAFQYINSCDEDFVKPCGDDIIEEIWAPLYEACPNYECTKGCQEKTAGAKKHECLGDLKGVQQGFESAGAGLAFQYINSCDEDFVKPCGDEVFENIWASLYEACPNYKCTKACQEKTAGAKKHECLGDLKAVQEGFEQIGQGAAFRYIKSCDTDKTNAQTTCHQSGVLLLFVNILMWVLVVP